MDACAGIYSATVHAVDAILRVEEMSRQSSRSALGGKTMNKMHQHAYMARLSRRLTIDGTPVNSEYFTVRSEGTEIGAKTALVQAKGEQRVDGVWAHQR
jgi:hypothetical protein